MDAATARARALAQFGDPEQIRRACNEEAEMADRVAGRMERASSWLDDARYGVRTLLRSPLYALVIVVTLGFGIGAVAAVFSTLSPYFVRALPFADASRLVHLFTVNPLENYDRDRFSLAQFEDVRQRARGFEDLAAYYYTSANLSGNEAAEQVTIGRMTSNSFRVLGAAPLLGRTFAAGEDGVAGSDVLVLGWGLWQRQYAGDPSIVGQTVRVDGVPHTVIGVMARDFNFPFGGVKAWAPARENALTEGRDRAYFLVFGRMLDGWTSERVKAELSALWTQLAAEHPDVDGRKTGIEVLGMRAALNFAWDILRVAFMAIAGAVLFVLLIACANIMGLGLARASTRRREVAVRSAIGAPRHRVLRQVMIESAVLSVLGAGLGLVLAHGLLAVVAPLVPEDLYAVGEFRVDGVVVAVTAAVTVFTALLIGMAPALSSANVTPADALRDGRSGAAGRRTSRLRGVLVVGELALGLVLAAGAGLMAQSLSRVSDVPLGFEPASLLTVNLAPPENAYPDAAALAGFYDRVIEAVAALPGTQAAAVTSLLPLNHGTAYAQYRVPGSGVTEDRLPNAERFVVSRGYFEAMQIRLVSGREFNVADVNGGERVAIVNRVFAERAFGGTDALGNTILLGAGDAVTHRIIGVADDVRHSSVVASPPAQVYVASSQVGGRSRYLVARASADPAALAAVIRAAIATLDPDVPANQLRPMDAIVNESVGPFAAMSIVLGVFGAFALLLASIGLYGLIAYSVSQRQAEFGVRMALGADPGELLRGVLEDGLRLAGAGVAIGLIGALVSGRVLTSLLFGVKANDPLTLAAAALLFVVVALIATAVPALRASRSDPLAALRAQ